MEPYHSDDRQIATLTDNQRREIQGTTDVDRTGQHRRNFYSDMRHRIKVGIDDFHLINKCLDESDIELIFDSWENATEHEEQWTDQNRLEIAGNRVAVQSFIALVYRGYRLNDIEPERVVNIIQEGLRLGHAQYQNVETTDVVADLELKELKDYSNTDDMDTLEKFKNDLPLSIQEWQRLGERVSKIEGRDVAFDEVSELVEKHLID